MIRVVFSVFVAAMLAGGLPPNPVAAQQSGAAEAPFDTDKPIDISADEADVRQNERLVVLKGNVVAIQGDMQLEADAVSVFYNQGDDASEAPAEGGIAGRIERLEATGNVKVTRPDQVVRAAKAFYRMSDNEVVMTGNVTATHKKNVINSDKVIIDLRKNTIRLGTPSASSGRVKGLFVPDKKTETKPE